MVLTPELAILDIGLAQLPKSFQTIIQHILISAHFEIAQHWNSPKPLKIAGVTRRTNYHYHCDTKLIITPPRWKLLSSLWEPWTTSKLYKWLSVTCCLSHQSIVHFVKSETAPFPFYSPSFSFLCCSLTFPLPSPWSLPHFSPFYPLPFIEIWVSVIFIVWIIQSVY